MGSESAIRIARHARATGWRFPRFTDDPVAQFATEEALIVRLERHEAEPVVTEPETSTDDPAAFARNVQAQLAEAGV